LKLLRCIAHDGRYDAIATALADVSTETPFELTAERGKSGLSDFDIVLGGIEARADSTDYLSVNDDRQATLHLDEAACRDGQD
jgi:hypothetical protein